MGLFTIFKTKKKVLGSLVAVASYVNLQNDAYRDHLITSVISQPRQHTTLLIFILVKTRNTAD